ncbi:hypothetical protein ISCGN_032020 [Ixodes scapularis]
MQRRRDWGGRVPGASVVCTALFTFWCLRHSTTSAQLRHKLAHVMVVVWTKLRETIIRKGEKTMVVVTQETAVTARPRRGSLTAPKEHAAQARYTNHVDSAERREKTLLTSLVTLAQRSKKTSKKGRWLDG